MTGYKDFNAPAFFDAAASLRAVGHDVRSPAENNANAGFDHTLSTLDGWDREGAWRFDIEAVFWCEGVVLLPGWERSQGAMIEANLAEVLQRKLFAYSEAGELVALPSGAAKAVVGRRPARAGDPRFHALLEQMADLHDRKQLDYGAASDPFANVRASTRFGVEPWVGALIRLNDKVERLARFAQRGSLANESAEDSMLDIAVYSLISLILYREVSARSTHPAYSESVPNGGANLPTTGTVGTF